MSYFADVGKHNINSLACGVVEQHGFNLRFLLYFILPVVLYGCDTWSLNLREERRLRVLENRMLRRIFGSRRDEVTGEWRKLRIEELNDLYSSPYIVRVIKSRRMKCAVHIACMEERRDVYRALAGKPEGKRPFGKPRCRWKNNTKWNFKQWDVGVWTGMNWLRIGTSGGG